ncbi:MAG: glycosyltransferase [wastewater metagenome]|nr:glycosyltransferase [Candidatus Loosdrechtia aerotolerans]
MVPKVSVIVPTYNRAHLLRMAIVSILNQTFQDFEILVIDDCSNDGTQEVIRDFHDKRVQYIRHKVNKGEAGARNTGILNSNAEYIAFLDDDDAWLPEKLMLQVNLLKKCPPEVGGIYTSCIEIDGINKRTSWQRTATKRGYIYYDMFIENCVGTPSTVIVRRECFKKVGLFDESLGFGTDYDMWIRISREFRFEYIKEPLVKYYVHNNRISSNLEIRIIGMEKILKRYYRFFTLNRKGYSRFQRRLGVLYCYTGNNKKGRRMLLNAILIYPFEIKGYFNLGFSILNTNNFRRLMELKKKFFNNPQR